MALLALDYIPSLDSITNILYVALGLGLVIFFHELGHFAVAKWCNVYVERFSIGFGPILWSRKKGETEYALSWIPFGGYVKMLGQDDMDPSQLSSEEIAEDPRSYSAKPVWMRMAIISAGVIMNIITAVLFYAAAYGVGFESLPPIVGRVEAGMPAWTMGLEAGDEITKINGGEIRSFSDIIPAVALSSGALNVEGKKPDGTLFEMNIEPDSQGTRPSLGLSPSVDLTLPKLEDLKPENQDQSITSPGSAAAQADPPFKPGDTVRTLNGEPVATYPEMANLLARRRSETVLFGVQRAGAAEDDLTQIKVGPNHFRRLGLRMEIGTIVAVKKNSPADHEGLKPGDKITKINGKAVGTEIDPVHLPNYLAEHQGQEVKISYSREVEGGQPEELVSSLVPLDKPGWIERPSGLGVPLSIPAIGIAFHLIPTVLHIDENSPAAGTIQKGDTIKKMEFILPEEAGPDESEKDRKPFTFTFSEKEKNWAYAFWIMQQTPQREIKLTFSHEGKDQTAQFQPKRDEEWFLPIRGFSVSMRTRELKEGTFLGAIQRGATATRKAVIDTYLTLRSLFSGRISFKEMRGPVGIATFAFKSAESGLAPLSRFLGFLSVNLAVLNFLPIPVLDGGHMVFLCWEAITRRKPSERVLIAATYVGMVFVLGLMITVLCLDFFVHGFG